MTFEEDRKELEELIRLTWPGWEAFAVDLVKQKGLGQEDLCRYAFVAGAISAHAVILGRMP